MYVEIEELKELHRMQLAAISTACGQNTKNSALQRIPQSNVYWTPAYEDVCLAVDREIAEREKAELQQAPNNYKTLYENAVVHLKERDAKIEELNGKVRELQQLLQKDKDRAEFEAWWATDLCKTVEDLGESQQKNIAWDAWKAARNQSK